MRVVDLNGNIHKWNLTRHTTDGLETRPRSELHLSIRDFLKERFPTLQILEEVPLPGTRLTVDFFIPFQKLAVEAHGIQHYEYVPFFHINRVGFAESQKRDKDKAEWFLNNNIRLIIFSYKEGKNEWAIKI
jgi:very-short-patch-repair endonuclease